MRKLTDRTGRLMIAIGIVAVLIIVVVIVGVVGNTAEAEEPGPQAVKSMESGGHSGGIIGEEEEISVDTLEEDIRDMGLLITQEYMFTDAVSQSKVKTLFSLTLGFTESSYLATYDGTVTAGIDFSEISVIPDRQGKTVSIVMPKASIQNVDVDPASFVLYSEKNGLGNPLSVSDFNGSLIELEEKARERAVERGILEQADENARQIIETFIGRFPELRDWSILWDDE